MVDLEFIDEAVIEKVRTVFGGDRIICLLRYGPKTKSDGLPPSDFDYLILLNKYQNDDYLLASQFNKLNLPIEVFLDYKDEILYKGIKNYQRGRHGSYFFKILASADILIGKNFYKENEDKLDSSKINIDLLYRIEEYFYRIQKSIVNDLNPKKSEIDKYLGRILTDLLLVAGNIDFIDMHKYHYTAILSRFSNDNKIVSNSIRNLILKFQSESNLDINLLGEIIGVLYKEYLSLQKGII